MDKAYVSDFTRFIEQFLKVHPEVVDEQRRNWRSFWEVQPDRTATACGKQDFVPDDHYGFH